MPLGTRLGHDLSEVRRSKRPQPAPRALVDACGAHDDADVICVALDDLDLRRETLRAEAITHSRRREGGRRRSGDSRRNQQAGHVRRDCRKNA